MGFFKRLDYKKFGIVMLLSLVLVTIISSLISNYSSIPVVKTGPAFVLLLVSTFIIYFFVIVGDGKLDKKEIWTIVFLAVALLGSGWAIKSYFPDIFSAFPQQTKQLFSSWGI